MLKIGVLSLQGAIESHEAMISLAAKELSIDVEVSRVILPEEIYPIDGLVLPGGESTAMTLIGSRNGMLDAVRSKLSKGMPAFGTCAGAILLSKSVRRNADTPSKGGVFPVINMDIIRNGYGRQKDSFSTKLQIMDSEELIPGIFIRAPVIASVGNDVSILSEVAEKPVMVREKNIIATTFHPELSDNAFVHKMFLQLVQKTKS